MAEHHLTVASAVIVPEQITPQESSLSSAKRAGLPFVSETKKRVRLDNANLETSVLSARGDSNSNRTDRRLSEAVEERKRGKRLFGALLGTLSQSSSSAAEKRRLDIEKKQQAKLKSQSEQLDEKRKQRHDALQEVQKQEQKKYERQSLLIRHSNEMSMARFLTTKTKPELYYKPWELLPEEKDQIAVQVKEVEARVEEESSRRRSHHALLEGMETRHNSAQPVSANGSPKLTTGDDANIVVSHDQFQPEFTDLGACNAPEVIKTCFKNHDRDQIEDTGEVVEGDEDTVIY